MHKMLCSSYSEIISSLSAFLIFKNYLTNFSPKVALSVYSEVIFKKALQCAKPS